MVTLKISVARNSIGCKVAYTLKTANRNKDLFFVVKIVGKDDIKGLFGDIEIIGRKTKKAKSILSATIQFFLMISVGVWLSEAIIKGLKNKTNEERKKS